MIRCEDKCVGCGIPCMRTGCPYVRVPICFCDLCGSSEGEYRIEGVDMCKSCAGFYLTEQFKKLSPQEQAEALDIPIERVDT